jgi:hypothetical protein
MRSRFFNAPKVSKKGLFPHLKRPTLDIWLPSQAADISRRKHSSWLRQHRRNNIPVYLTWRDFDGSWPKKSSDIGFRQHLIRVKSQDETNLHLAKQRLLSYPFKEAYSFWPLYYKAYDIKNPNIEGLSDHVVQLASIASVLRTAPPRIAKAFRSDAVELTVSHEAMLKDMITLRSLQITRTHFRYFPLYAQARARHYRIVRRDRLQKKIDRLRRKYFGYSKDEKQEQSDTETLASQNLTALIDAFHQAFNAHPDSWGIEPLHIVINFVGVQIRRHLRYMTSSNLRRLVGKSRWQDMQDIILGALELPGQTRELSDELLALRYWRLQLFPGSISETEGKLGKDLWTLVRTECGADGSGDVVKVSREAGRERKKWRSRYIYKDFSSEEAVERFRVRRVAINRT